MKMKQIRIGSRGSQLALWQARYVQSELEKRHPGLSVTITKIKTTGDQILDVPLAQVGGKGLFVKEIEEALLENEVDIAVHSMKDMPADLPEGLCIAAVPKREDPRDVLISRDGSGFLHLPHGAHVGTSSLRRISQLLNQRPDLRITPLRGNLDTRLKKLDSGAFDAIVLAAAGIRRLGWEGRITEYLPITISLPAIGQGALCIECRKGDTTVFERINGMDHPETRICVRAERAFLKRLEGGCQVPIGAYATIVQGVLEIEGLVASVDGGRMVREKRAAGIDNPEKLGVSLAESLLAQGGEEILREVYEAR
ncbi:MAG: hydroxymethylbilane synthase [Nitrospirae bacterium]|nr:hydroxymethylbilane synthase [Nitrospirota bacterium]